VNRINVLRGWSIVDMDADLIRALIEQGLPEEEIAQHLGIDLDTVYRYKQVTGIAELFRGAAYSQSGKWWRWKMEWKYGDAWERYPIEQGQIWGIGESRVAVHNLFEPLPGFMAADMLFTDPPWNLGNINSFYTKAERVDYQKSFTPFVDALFQRIAEISPGVCYLEIGNQNVNDFERRLRDQFAAVQRWQVTYYKKHPTWIIRGADQPTQRDYSGMDEADVIKMAAAAEEYQVIGDMCMGRGLVGLAAYAAGHAFVGTELNKRRLACLLEALAKKGADVVRYE